MSRARLLLAALLVLVPVLALAGLAYAGRTAARLPARTSVGGVDVGGLTDTAALDRLERRLGRPAGRGVLVQVGVRQYRLSAAQAGVALDLPAAVQTAAERRDDQGAISRGWDKLMGRGQSIAVPVHVTADRSRVRAFVGSIHAAIARRPVDATSQLTVRAVTTTPSRVGWRLGGREDLVGRISRALTSPGGRRRFSAHAVEVAPRVTTADVSGGDALALTVSKADKLVRVFRGSRLVRSYHVAVGMDKYPTPDGRFAVQDIEKNPVWTVPDSAWAGKLAGKVIPGGSPENPLKAYFVRFDGSVGFHGTAELGSIGSAASHGCIRMDPADVTDLAQRVAVGTPVLVGT